MSAPKTPNADAFRAAIRAAKTATWRETVADGITEPDWAPLHRIFGACPEDGTHTAACGFMFVGSFNGVRAYKHGITRRYLNLDSHGQAYRYNADAAGRYSRIPLSDAIADAFKGIESLNATADTPYDADYRAKRNDALRAAGYTVVS